MPATRRPGADGGHATTSEPLARPGLPIDRQPEPVSALASTSPTEVCEIPSRATGERD
jgi:hypothetical protein